MKTFTVTASLTQRTATGALDWDSTEKTAVVNVRKRSDAHMAARYQWEREALAAGQRADFVLTFRSVTLKGDKQPWRQLSEASSPTGAAMGRLTILPRDPKARAVFYLSRVRLDTGGYDQGGAYWGIGDPLYRALSAEDIGENDEHVELFVRASSRDYAKDAIKARVPGATFYR